MESEEDECGEIQDLDDGQDGSTETKRDWSSDDPGNEAANDHTRSLPVDDPEDGCDRPGARLGKGGCGDAHRKTKEKWKRKE